VTYQGSVWFSSSYLELTPSVEGEDLYLDAPMTNITFHYDANAASASSSGSIVGPYNGNGTAWQVDSTYHNNLFHYKAMGDTLYFSSGGELWESDGTTSGTVKVKDINGNSGGSSLFAMDTIFDNNLYFRANDGTNGVELWKTDGTSSGTVLVKDINSGGSSSPANFKATDDTLYFVASDSNGRELWKSDGTASGTVMVKDINSGSGGSTPQHLTAIGNVLYFAALDGSLGRELYTNKGTHTEVIYS